MMFSALFRIWWVFFSSNLRIVGAGPQALAMASRLILNMEAMPDVIPPQESYIRRPKEVRAHLRKVRGLSCSLAVVDENGCWMQRWRNQFQALNISHLRSHEMMHPDAFDHSTLAVWAATKKRNDFLFLEKLPKEQDYHGPFVLPSSRLMLDFCKDLVKLGQLDDHLWHARAESMEPCGSGMMVAVNTATGMKQVHAKRVVVARGPSWRRQWPCFYHNLEPAALANIFHAWDLFDKPEHMDSLRGRGIIIGGGLTAAHLCAQLSPRGPLELLIRRDRRVKQYDLDIPWMGTKRRVNRREYEQSSLEQRVATNKAVRDGGSITPELNEVLVGLESKGLVNVHEWTEVVTASFDISTNLWTIALTDDTVLEAEYLICATGAAIDVGSDPLLKGLQKSHPLELHAGLPVLSESLQCLRWKMHVYSIQW